MKTPPKPSKSGWDWFLILMVAIAAILIGCYAWLVMWQSEQRGGCEAKGGIYASGSSLCLKKDAVLP